MTDSLVIVYQLKLGAEILALSGTGMPNYITYNWIRFDLIHDDCCILAFHLSSILQKDAHNNQ